MSQFSHPRYHLVYGAPAQETGSCHTDARTAPSSRMPCGGGNVHVCAPKTAAAHHVKLGRNVAQETLKLNFQLI